MKLKRYIPLFIVLALAAAVVAVALGPDADARETKKAAKPIDFTLKDINGKEVKLSDYRGKVVVVDVWATWCGYCVREIPDMIAMQEKAEKDKTNLQIVGISVDDNQQAVKPFVKEHGMNYPILLGDDKALKSLGEVYGLPTKFIIDDKGVVVDKIIGATDSATLQKKLSKYVKPLPKSSK